VSATPEVQETEADTQGAEVAAIAAALDALEKMRSALTGPSAISTARLSELQSIDAGILDDILAKRSKRDFDHVTFETALDYVSRGSKGRDNLLLQELKIVKHLPEARVRAIHQRSHDELRKRVRGGGTAAISREGDFKRHWAFIVGYVDDTVYGRGSRSRHWRTERSLYWMDGLIVLLSNVPRTVHKQTFHLSVSIAAGVLP
jgi:hypothetical protein